MLLYFVQVHSQMVIFVPVVVTNAICRLVESVMDTWKSACVRPCFMRVVVAMSELPFGEDRKCIVDEDDTHCGASCCSANMLLLAAMAKDRSARVNMTPPITEPFALRCLLSSCKVQTVVCSSTYSIWMPVVSVAKRSLAKIFCAIGVRFIVLIWQRGL